MWQQRTGAGRLSLAPADWLSNPLPSHPIASHSVSLVATQSQRMFVELMPPLAVSVLSGSPWLGAWLQKARLDDFQSYGRALHGFDDPCQHHLLRECKR